MKRQMFLNKNFAKVACVSEYLDQPLARAEIMSRLTTPILEALPQEVMEEYISMFKRVSKSQFSEDEPILPTSLLSEMLGLNQFDNFQNLTKKIEMMAEIPMHELSEIAVYGTDYSILQMQQYLQSLLVSDEFVKAFRKYMEQRW